MPFKTKEKYNDWKRKNYLKHRNKELERKRKYHSTEKGRAILYKSIERYRNKYPEKYKARQVLQYHVRKGYIEKGLCEDCGSKKVQAHHEDYTKPLEVRWLCAKCHNRVHRK